MTLHRPAHALNISRLLGKPPIDSGVAPDASPPMNETLLASELARIMQRRREPVAHMKTTEPKRWLGDDADQALVEHYVETTQEPAGEDGEAASLTQHAHDTVDDDPSPALANSVTASWMREARQQRRRSRLRDAGGWIISIAISALIIVAASLAMVGWPRIEATWRQVVAPGFDVSETSSKSAPQMRPAAAIPRL